MPRAGLSEQRVIDEAGQLADEVGLPNLTLAALAERLGVRQPSLYKHVDGMQAVQRGVAVRAKLDLADAIGRSAIGRSRADAVRALCESYRAWALEHPGRYASTVRAPDPADSEDLAASASAVKVVVDVLSGYGLSGVSAIDATRALRAAVHGFVSLETGGGFGLPQDVTDSFYSLVNALIAALDSDSFGPAS